MKLIIDIPEEEYKKRELGLFFGCYSTKLDEVICKGMPLPKDMEQFDERTMATAFAYAHYMMMLGVNITEKWDTVTQQSANLEQAYRKGYYDGIEKTIALHRGNTDEWDTISQRCNQWRND